MIFISTKVVRSIVLPALFASMAVASAQAQTADSARTAAPAVVKKDGKRVKGTIKDSQTGKPIPGISISVPDFSAAITDDKGQFSIIVPDLNALLQVSGQGYQVKEIPLKGRSSVSAALYADTYTSIYAQAVLPFGSGSLLHTTNAVSTVTVNDSWMRNGETSDTYLQGKMPGLNVVRRSGTPGIGGNLSVNGFTSLYATNQPLIVVDGVIFDNFSYGNSLTKGHVGNPLSNIDVKDITSYTLIKDAGAASYGTRGANGVLLITTNHTKVQATAIDFAAYGGFNSRVGNQPVMNSRDFRTYLSDMLLTTPGQTAASIQAKPYFNDNPNPEYYRYHNETNWQDQVLGNSYDQNYYVKITGGDDIATYALSVGYLNEKGIIKNTNSQRYQTRFNANLNLSKKFTSTVSLSFVNNQQQLQDQGIAPKTGAMYLALIKAPFLTPHEVNATGEQSPNYADYDSLNVSNPGALISKFQGKNTSYRFFGSIGFKYDITPKISLQTIFGITFDKVRENRFVPGLGVVPDTLATAVTTNQSASSTQRLYTLYSDTYGSYRTKIGRSQSLVFNLGLRYQTNNREIDFGYGYNSATDDYVSVTGGVPALRTAGGENGKWNWMNVYANANYELLNKYFLSATISTDASSRFGRTASAPLTLSGNKMSVMPAVSVGWLVSSEKFMADLKFIEVLKLRASYGVVGNDDIGNYSARQIYVSQNYLGSQGIVRGNIANTGLKWESVRKADVGLDASFLNERLNVTVDYFNNHTTNMITFEPVLSITGFSYALTNNSAMKTNGINAGISGRVLNKALIWDVGFNVSSFKNKLTSIPNGQLITNYAGGTIISKVGQQANLFYGLKSNGVYASDAEAVDAGLQNRREDGTVTPFRGGDVRFTDTNNDGFIDNADRQVIGNPNPDLTGGFSTMVAYKRFTVDVLLNWSLGNDVYNYTRRQLMSGSGYQNQLQIVNNRWRAQGQVTEVPRAEYGDPAGNSRFSDRWIESGSYLRLRNVSVSYNVPLKLKGIKSARIYAIGTNLLTLSGYQGYDPEFSAPGNIFSQGTDIGLQPQYRSVQLGVRVGL